MSEPRPMDLAPLGALLLLLSLLALVFGARAEADERAPSRTSGAAPVDAAPSPDAPVGLDGAAAIERALAAHPGYRAAAIELQRARLHARAEASRWVPTLHLEGGLNVGNTPSLQANRSVAFPYSEVVQLAAELAQPFDTGTTLALRMTGSRRFSRSVLSFIEGADPFTYVLGPGYGLDVTLTATQAFLRGFGPDVGRAEQRSAEAALETAEAGRARRASELVRDTLRAYAELWYAEEVVTLDEAARALAIRQRDDARARLEIGVIAPADVLAFATRVASLEEALALASADRRGKAVLLATLLGMPLGSELHAEREPPHLPAEIDEASAVALAVAHAPELVQLRARVEEARRAARIAAEPLRPRLDAQAQLGLHGLAYEDAAEPFAQVGTFAAFTAMLNLVYEMPLDDARLNAEAERARLAVEAAQAQADEARVTIEQQVMALLEQRRASQRRVELAEETIELAQRSVEAERGRLEVGTTTPMTLLLAEEEERSAALRLRRARTDLYSANVALLALTGQLLDGLELPE